MKHFLSLLDYDADTLSALIERAIALKTEWKSGQTSNALQQRTLGMVFTKSSTRTRVSFETGMTQLGGHALFLSPRDTQLGRGEPIPDTARVLGSMVDAVMIRNDSQQELELFAQYSKAPVINGLTDELHPCQLLADVMTFVEHRGAIKGATVAWVGDGNNVCHSWINAARQFDFTLNIACPEGYLPDSKWTAPAADRVQITQDANQACKDADLIVTDVWTSMGQEDESCSRTSVFEPYQVNTDLMRRADHDALFMHCLPAHRGEEVTADVIDGPQSVVWDEAENRLHAQKALLEYIMTTNR